MFLPALICILLNGFVCVNASWDDWWTYDGISGTDFWGLLNPDWNLCNRGKRQSPINIEPSNLLYDPDLGAVHVDRFRVSGTLQNNGHSMIFQVEQEGTGVSGDESTPTSSPPLMVGNDISQVPAKSEQNGIHLPATVVPGAGTQAVKISGGPFSYNYLFDSIYLHFGRTDSHGSEHIVAGVSFPAEVQIVGYNSDLYQNMTEASNKANGLAGIALLIQLGNSSNSEIRTLTSLAHNIRFRGQNVTIKSISVRDLIPDLTRYMTYEGSLTIPGCSETVTWIVINKPIFITRQQLYTLRKLMQGDASSPKAPLGNNFRPTQPLNHRVVRTNIDFRRNQGKECPSMKTNMKYQVNTKHLKK